MGGQRCGERVTTVRKIGARCFVPAGIALVCALAAPFADEYVLQMLCSSLLFGNLAMAFDFTAGFINIVNWGYAGLWGFGAYASAILSRRCGVSSWLGLLFGSSAAAVLGLIIGVLTLRLRGIYAAVMAWFVALTLSGLAANLVGLTRGHLGLHVPLLFETAERLPYFYVLLVLTLFTYGVLRMITNSHVGLAFRAIGQEAVAAATCGINATRYKLLNWVVSSAFAGLFGAFYAHFVGILTPDVMHTSHTIEILALAYVGGRGSLWGGLLASFVVLTLLEYLRPLMELRQLVYGLLLVGVMIFYPGGLCAALTQLRAWLTERRDGKRLKC